MTASDRMVVWLREAVDAAQHDAEAAGGDGWRRQYHPSDTVAVYDSKGEPVVYDEGSPTEEQQAHIVRHDPAAVLRRITADRKMLGEHQPVPDHGRFSHSYGDWCPDWCEGACRNQPQVCLTCRDSAGDPIESPCNSLRLLAEGWGWTEETTCIQ